MKTQEALTTDIMQFLLSNGLKSEYCQKILRSKYTKEEDIRDFSRLFVELYRGMFDRGDGRLKNEFERENGHYPYIPFGGGVFYQNIIIQAMKLNCKSFLDVGSGVGDKVFLAYLFGNFDSSTGIEYNKITFDISEMLYFQRVHLNSKIKFLNEDALKFDYSNYDFIYMYSPMYKQETMYELYALILKSMQVGSYVVDVYGTQLTSFLIRKGFINNSRGETSIYQKISDSKVKRI